jgi:micrococcal nuclease
MYEYRATILRVIDGDTVDVDIDLGFGIWQRSERVRIMGIDTPESRTSDEEEKVFGKAAKKRLIELLQEHTILMTEVNKAGEDMKGKFGRILGDFKTDNGTKVTEVLINEGHAVAYFGGAKEDVQKQHLVNRERLIAEGVVKL